MRRLAFLARGPLVFEGDCGYGLVALRLLWPQAVAGILSGCTLMPARMLFAECGIMPGPRDSELPWRTALLSARSILPRLHGRVLVTSGADSWSDTVPSARRISAVCRRFAGDCAPFGRVDSEAISLTASHTGWCSGFKARPWHARLCLVSAAIVAMGGTDWPFRAIV